MYYQKRIIHELLENQNDLGSITNITVSSVVPFLNEIFIQMLADLFKKEIRLVNHNSYPGLTISTDNPDEMGTDLIANAVAAVHEVGEDSIIVDFGTALTFTVVEKNFNILGVAIAPGLMTALKALHGGTAQLPEVPADLPETVIGKNTAHAIQSGVFRGYVGLVKEIIKTIEADETKRFKRIATGGLSHVLSPLNDEFDVIKKDLTLNGIRLIGESMS